MNKNNMNNNDNDVIGLWINGDTRTEIKKMIDYYIIRIC